MLRSAVEPARIILDPDSGDTLQTVRTAAALVRRAGYAECLACTDPYHQPRARMLFALYGIRCRSVAFTRRGPARLRRSMQLRELAAIPYDLVAGIGARWRDRADLRNG